MKAVVYDRYGPPEVLRLVDIPRPIPGRDEILVRVHSTTVNRTDAGLRSAEYFISRFLTGLLRPRRGRRIPGGEFAGQVEEVGSSVSEFRTGERVFGVSVKGGAQAEFVALKEKASLAHMPEGISFDEAAAVCDGAILALAYLKKLELSKESRVLVYGASGSIGTAGVQLAKHFGAHVTAVSSTRNVELVRSLGPDEVIDYERDDFTGSGELYDLVFDAVGKLSFKRCKGFLKPGGAYASTDLGPHAQNPFLALSTRVIGDKKVLFPIPRYTKADVLLVKELLEAGRYRAVIDRVYPLKDVIEATRYVETGQKTGNVVLRIAD